MTRPANVSHLHLGYGDPNTDQPFGYRNIYDTPKELLYFGLRDDQIPNPERHFDWQLAGTLQSDIFQSLQPWEVQLAPMSDIHRPSTFPMRPPPGSEEEESEEEEIQQVIAGKLTASPFRKMNAHMAQTAGGGPKKGTKTGRTAVESDTKAGPDTSAETNGNVNANANANAHANENANLGDNDAQARSERLASANPLGMEITTTPASPDASTSHNLLNLGHNTVPTLSLSVLTPSEVRQLQRDYKTLRRSTLCRELWCPYFGCSAKFSRRQPDRLQRHLHERHVVRRCNFCDVPERPGQSVGERMAHMREKHMDVFRMMAAEEDGLEVPLGRPRTKKAAGKAEKAKPALKANKRKRTQKR